MKHPFVINDKGKLVSQQRYLRTKAIRRTILEKEKRFSALNPNISLYKRIIQSWSLDESSL